MPRFEKLNEEKAQARLALYEAGFSDKDASEILGISEATYRSWRRAKNLPNLYKTEDGTLCWKCKKTNRFDCCWFDPDNPQPVDGWVAKETVLYCSSGGYKRETPSYHVYECPNFDIMEEYKPENTVKAASGRVAIRKDKE